MPPLYRITDTLTGQDYGYEADTPAQARSAIVADRFAVKTMTPQEAIQLSRSGVEIVLAEMTDTEHHIALRDAHEIAAERDYFNARPEITNDGRATMLFEAGFRRGFDAAAQLNLDRLAAAERDAARYRWLADQMTHVGHPNGAGWTLDVVVRSDDKDLDDVIDCARGEWGE